MAACRHLFTDEHAALVVCTIRVGRMFYGLNKTLQMCTVEIESGLGYKSSQVRVQIQVQQSQVRVHVVSVQVRVQVAYKSSKVD